MRLLLDPRGRLRLVAEIPPAFDVHAHLGIAVLLAPRVDLAARSERVLHFLDCDATDPGCELDLDVYINGNFTEESLRDLEWELARQLVLGSRKARTHTIPNLLDEMDAVGVAKAVAAGDLRSEIRVETKDEVGELLQALKEMNAGLVRIVTEVRQGSDGIAIGTNQIATGNQDLSQRTEEQATNLQQTAASMEQLTGTVRTNAATARSASEVAASACRVATDGGDGPTDAAGAICDGRTVSRSKLSPREHLAQNDSYPFFDALGDLIRTGPTGTNVMDVRLVLVS